MNLLQMVILALVISVTMYTELKDGKIYNWMTLPVIVAGLFLGFTDGGVDLLKDRFWGMLIGGGIFLLPYLIFAMGNRSRPVIGGGDVKLAAAIGAVCGVGFTLHTIKWAIYIGALIGLGVILHQMWKNKQVEKTGIGEKVSPFARRIPFGTAMCVGLMLSFVDLYLKLW